MRVVAIILTVALAACSQVPSQDHDSMRMRGHVGHGGQGLVFQSCSAGAPEQLQDGLSDISLVELLGELGLGEDRNIFVDLVVQQQEGSLKATKLIHAAHGETKGCDEDPEFLWKANGNEPFWSAQVDVEEARISRLAETTREWRFSNPVAESQGELWRYSLGEADGEPVLLELRRNACRDSMSGHYFAYGAVLRIGEEQLTGCARTGRALAAPGLRSQL
ncbi:MAG: hypothetical protein ACQETX_07820 [Pseudomonadota bacterium]